VIKAFNVNVPSTEMTKKCMLAADDGQPSVEKSTGNCRDNRVARASSVAPRRGTVLSGCLLLTGFFVLSRLYCYYAGVRFDWYQIAATWQILNVDLLSQDLLRSVYYLHSQPPLFNVAVATVFKLFTGHEGLVFAIVYKAMGLTTILSLFLLMIRLGVSGTVAIAVTTLLIAAPAAILWENWLFYDYPVTCLLTVSALSLHIAVTRQRIGAMFLFFSILSAIVLTRSAFHLVWFCSIAIMLLILLPHVRKKVLIAFVIAALPVMLWYAKNLWLFGTFVSSSWLGMSLNKTYVAYNLSAEERKALAAQGLISHVSVIGPFAPIAAYKEHMRNIPGTGIPVLDLEEKAPGEPNLNNVVVLEASTALLEDALAVMVTYPQRVGTRLLSSFGRFFFSPGDHYWVRENAAHISEIIALYDIIVYGVVGQVWGDKASLLLKPGLFLILAVCFSILAGFSLSVRSLADQSERLSDGVTLFFMWFNILYVAVLFNIVEAGENYRFRMLIEPFVLVILSVYLSRRRSKSEAIAKETGSS